MRILNKITVLAVTLLLTVGSFHAFAQTVEEEVGELKGRVEGIDETVNTLTTDVSGLKKLKISGYFQGQYQHTDKMGGFGKDAYDANESIQDRIMLRRARVKFDYKGKNTGVVIQGDFLNSGFTLKDAYLDFTEPFANLLKFRVGLFNRPNFEVEYSSSQRESMERSEVIRTLYPNERDLGAMITINPDDMFNLQVAAFNNTYTGPIRQLLPNHKYFPLYYMLRLTKEFYVPSADLAFDLGAHARIGQMAANNTSTIASETNTAVTNAVAIGDGINRTWYGVEGRIFWDFLGGMKILGEYIMGSNADQMSTDGSKAIRLREFAGYYVLFVKNLGTDWQLALKYDSYDPNTKIADGDITNANDLTINTIGLGIHNYTLDKIRLSLWFDLISRQTNDAFTTSPVNNLTTLRFQYKY